MINILTFVMQIVVLSALVLVHATVVAAASIGLKCVCNQDECDLIHPNDCPGKGIIVWDPCKCCKVCAKTLGEACGGLYGFSGTCEPPYQCVLKPSVAMSGVCLDLPTSSALVKCRDFVTLVPGCEIVNRKCRCWDRIRICSDSPYTKWSYSNLEECELNLKNVIDTDFGDSEEIYTRSSTLASSQLHV